MQTILFGSNRENHREIQFLFEQAEKLLLDGKAREYDKDLENIKTAIQLKFKLSDRLNKQLNQLIEAAGGKENDPLHLKVNYPHFHTNLAFALYV